MGDEPRELLGVVLHGLFPWWNRRTARLVGAVVALGAIGWFTPMSPGALRRADVTLSGDPAAAAAQYDAIARFNPLPSVRREARWRAALVYAAWLGEPEAARQRLEAYADGATAGEKRAEVEEQLGQLLVDAQPRAAAEAFDRAWRSAPRSERAARRLALAAGAWREAGDNARAEAAWSALADAYPAQRATAEIGRGQLAFAANDAEAALRHYEAAVDAATDPLDAELARRGVAQALERMGDLRDAVAAFDVEPQDVEARKERQRSLVLGRGAR